MTFRRITVFCGSRFGRQPAYREAAVHVGRRLAELGIGVVYGGGDIGLMGAVATAALEQGGEVIGVIPKFMIPHELAHSWLTQLIEVDSMHERKATMADLADGFITLPGGLGTFEEMFEIATWNQLGIQSKPIGLLNVAGYFDPVVALLDHALDEGFVRREHRLALMVESDLEALVEAMRRFEAATSALSEYPVRG
ncbi:MAG TPA: TIGR00730 family Rossman fold protein [Fimbriimonadaceae bacterium]|nr:TIGR00730 family Rossman fold protein [Fimbriimonadaceae bacterium]